MTTYGEKFSAEEVKEMISSAVDVDGKVRSEEEMRGQASARRAQFEMMMLVMMTPSYPKFIRISSIPRHLLTGPHKSITRSTLMCRCTMKTSLSCLPPIDDDKSSFFGVVVDGD